MSFEIHELVRTWQTNERITQELLGLCPDDAFDLKPGSGKTIRSNFVHIVSVRRSWAAEKAKSECALVPSLDWKSASRDELSTGLRLSSDAVAAALEAIAANPRSKAEAALTLFAHLLAHDAHHRSQIEISLRMGVVELDDKTLFSLWNWNRR